MNHQPSGYEPDELPIAPSRDNFLNGGGGRIRTFEVEDNGFTVRPSWPLWYPSKSLVWSRAQDLNPQPADYKSAALPIELARLSTDYFTHVFHYCQALFVIFLRILQNYLRLSKYFSIFRFTRCKALSIDFTGLFSHHEIS